jgi:DNA-binding NarL/FixJ family response regulator
LQAPDKKTRVAVCEDHHPFREGVIEMLSLAGDIEVVAEAATHEECLAAVLEHAPDVVLLDLEMPGGTMGADESMARMLGVPSSPKVVVFTMHDEPGMVMRFLRRGACAYVPKSAEMGELVEAVRDAARGDTAEDSTAPSSEQGRRARKPWAGEWRAAPSASAAKRTSHSWSKSATASPG